MRALAVAALGAVIASANAGGTETLDPNRVHVVAPVSPTGNWIFRSNMPLVNGPNGTLEFAYDELTQLFQQKGVSEANATFPEQYYLEIISFNNVFDLDQQEVQWAQANPSLGNFTNWVLVGQLLGPGSYSQAEQVTWVTTNATELWWVDQLPTRIPDLRAMWSASYAIPRVYLFHCTAGCDRTGEFAAAWYMKYGDAAGTQLGWADALALDTADCGRTPEQLSINAAQWYCVHLQVNEGINNGACY